MIPSPLWEAKRFTLVLLDLRRPGKGGVSGCTIASGRKIKKQAI